MERKYSILSSSHIIWKIVYNDKRVTKNALMAVYFDDLLKDLADHSYRLYVQGVILLGIARIYSKIHKHLHDEVSLLLSSLSNPSLRVVKNKHINLKINDGIDYLSDSFLKDEDILILPESGFIEDTFVEDLDFHDVSVEEMRASGSTSITQIQMRPKRRKVIVDEKIEFDTHEFKRMVSDTRKLLDYARPCIEDLFSSRFHVPNEVVSKLEEVERERRESIEIAREGTMVESYMDIDYSGGYEEHKSTESLDSERVEDITFPSSFEFCENVSGMSAYERAIAFMKLLNLTSEGRMTATQEEPFGKIFCSAA